MLARAERGAAGRLAPGPPTAAAFAFDAEHRDQCGETGRASYLRSRSHLLGLSIPLEAATNKAALEGFQARGAAAPHTKLYLLVWLGPMRRAPMMATCIKALSPAVCSFEARASEACSLQPFSCQV